MAFLFIGLWTPAEAETDYPRVPEPMVFDMMRPLGAKRGELEVNTLATTSLSGPDKTIQWAPEVEYALTDGFAIEGELPFVDGRLVELKLGLQAAFGAFNGGRSAHGVQYLGIYDRDARHYRNSFAYMLAHRYNGRWSSISMAGLGDVSFSGGHGRNAAIVNHSFFYDSMEGQVLGLELNYRGGTDGYVLAMPQIHQRLAAKINVQAGIGAERPRGEVFRPKAGVRLVREF
ncbi:hypothetical protein MOK15_09170 [Sphingobium sp. BYY-5]|uniref:hypothetical protein n=1 Tax=Sphingobium sp. BYY-5 TaxID=2926400 RepID=UPI001FA75365|nr:hypothetical protein [Sphingobium sp. BYY-5]MCI4590266.1 hypothetical protein [Sphingobium sp. BYY-5]